MNSRPWLRIAHRGASGTRPEHTRAAFEEALRIGVDMIELDVQLTRDEQLLVHHDGELGRTIPGQGSVREHTLAELRSRDCGGWFSPEYAGQTPLTLEEVLDLVGTQARLNVEVKSEGSASEDVVRRLLECLRKSGAMKSTIVSSFDPVILETLRARSDEVAIGLLWHLPEWDEAWRLASDLQAISLHPFFAILNEAVVAEAHRQGLSVLTWTVNDADMVRTLLTWGVDGVMSDYPAMLRSVALGGGGNAP